MKTRPSEALTTEGSGGYDQTHAQSQQYKAVSAAAGRFDPSIVLAFSSARRSCACMSDKPDQTILVIGGYGLIGHAIVQALSARGARVIGAGRHPQTGLQAEPDLEWRSVDLADPNSVTNLNLEGIDCVINAAGALQDNGADTLEAVHGTGVQTLIAHCEANSVSRFIQISAAGVSDSASTVFLRSKAVGDKAVQDSALDWVILRPGLMLGRDSFGGSSLLRALAGFPLVQPLTHADSLIYPVSLQDVADEAAAWALEDRPNRQTLDLAASAPVRLKDLVIALRQAMRLPPARIWSLPSVSASVMGAFGDLADHLGWRSPLRSTAMSVMSEGVKADPKAFEALTGRRLAPLSKILSQLSAAPQERAFARMFWIRPLIILTLSAFWMATGIITLINPGPALRLLAGTDLPDSAVAFTVYGGAIADIVLGVMVLIRRTHWLGLLGMVGLTLSYLTGASLYAPELWLDPAGLLVKPLPILVMTLIALMLKEPR